MILARLLYALGVICGALLGFLSPLWFLGFGPLCAGLIWAAYDLTEVASAEPASTPPRRPV